MMPICDYCGHAELHGYPPKGSPDWEVGTIFFWCAEHKDHKNRITDCQEFESGEPRMYDKHGELLGVDA